MLKLDVIVSRAASSAGVCAFTHGFAVEDGLRFVHINFRYATAASSAIELGLLVVQIVVSKFYGIRGFVDARVLCRA